MVPLVVDADGKVFALRVVARGGGTNWMLPSGADVEAWVRLALVQLHDLDADNFPLLSSWDTDPRYLTSAEANAMIELTEIQQERVRHERELADRSATAESSLTAARDAATAGQRQLVHAQGASLVEAVAIALRGLGFDVMEMDDNAAPGDRLEDLRIRPSPESTEVCITEVRGYAKSAQLNDFLRISRFVERYVKETGEAPERRWYIVNQFLRRGPGERGKPLASNPTEVESFGESGGLVVSTVDLLELCMRVDQATVTKEQAREWLWETTGLFNLPVQE